MTAGVEVDTSTKVCCWSRSNAENNVVGSLRKHALLLLCENNAGAPVLTTEKAGVTLVDTTGAQDATGATRNSAASSRDDDTIQYC